MQLSLNAIFIYLSLPTKVFLNKDKAETCGEWFNNSLIKIDVFLNKLDELMIQMTCT